MPATATRCCAWRLAPVTVCPERTSNLSRRTLAANSPSHPFRDFSSPQGSSTLSCQPWFYLRLQARRRLRPMALSGHTRGHTVTGGLWRFSPDALSDTIQLDTLPRTFIISDVNKDHAGNAVTTSPRVTPRFGL